VTAVLEYIEYTYLHGQLKGMIAKACLSELGGMVINSPIKALYLSKLSRRAIVVKRSLTKVEIEPMNPEVRVLTIELPLPATTTSCLVTYKCHKGLS